jgi:hypothetical protein
MNTSNIPPLWAAAGFTGAITYNPTIPPQYKIKCRRKSPYYRVAFALRNLHKALKGL